MPPPRFRKPPLYPPRSWFADPALREPTALTIDDSGRIRGHAALWDSAHIGLPNRVTPPRESSHQFFMTGEVRTMDGSSVATGRLSLGGGHADMNKGLAAATAHYDDVAAAVGDIRVGSDRWGIWMAGSLRPDVTEHQVRTLRASSVSADWRAVDGKLRMVAICAVNSAGYPVPRAQMALAASGAPSALVTQGPKPRTAAAKPAARTAPARPPARPAAKPAPTRPTAPLWASASTPDDMVRLRDLERRHAGQQASAARTRGLLFDAMVAAAGLAPDPAAEARAAEFDRLARQLDELG